MSTYNKFIKYKFEENNKIHIRWLHCNFICDTPIILLNDNSDNENLNCPVHFGDFVLVKYEGNKFYKYFVGYVEDTNNDNIKVFFLKRNLGDDDLTQYLKVL